MQSLPSASELPGIELVVVDQSADSSLRSLASDAVTYLPTPSEFGVSRARNRGVARARGNILGFPDDDCWYTASTIPAVLEQFRDPSVSAVVGEVQFVAPGEPEAACEPEAAPAAVTYRHFRSSATALFVRRGDFLECGGFDERIGPGGTWGMRAGEESDLVLRLLHAQKRVVHAPSVQVYHPPNVTTAGKAFAYGRSDARVWRLHRAAVGRGHFAYRTVRYLARPLRVFLEADGTWVAVARSAGFLLGLAHPAASR